MQSLQRGPALIDGRYRVVRSLGEGAFARTLACADTADDDRLVAVKELRVQGLRDWKPVELFERESRILATLRHPAVPEIHRHFEARSDGGELALYLVMELIDGPSLLERLRAGPALDQLEVVDLTLALLDVLDYLHGRAPPVFHRDIKPANVVLRRTGAPVLVDFGGVRDGWRPPTAGSTVTGTFGYMPPEQLLGQVAPASDLYALGATLLHVLTGSAPTEFSLESGRLKLPADLQVRPALRRTVDSLLAPAPRDRPPTARAARRLLLDEATGGRSGLVVRPDQETRVAIPRGGRPALIDVGPPPRDPDGDLGDVYQNLIDCIDGEVGGRGKLAAVGHHILVSLVGVVSLGFYPLWAWRVRVRRARDYGPLFREGLAAAGRLVNVRGMELGALFSTLTYEYDVDGHLYRASMDASHAVAAHLAIGDPVTVLYDAAAPVRSCLVYRWQG